MNTRGLWSRKKYFLRNFLFRHFRSYFGAEALDLLSLSYLQPLSENYLPWSQAALRPSGLVKIINEIYFSNHLNILECGGGISTVYIAKVLSQRSGHLFTVEHDQKWVDLINSWLEQAGLEKYVTIITAPLKPYELAITKDTLWYDDLAIKEKLSSLNIKLDLLIVDGPPAYSPDNRLSRYPALPFFSQFSHRNLTVILDDIDRSSELEILFKWEEEMGMRFNLFLADGCIAIGRYTSSSSET